MAKQQASGCLFGMALGDALGADTEFMTVEQIISKYPPRGPQAPSGNPARVTDDTQMALAVGRALLKVPHPYQRATLEPLLRAEFVAWMRSPDNNRAPGNTCMTACRRLETNYTWYAATVKSSKGCGANMRVQPVGLLPDIDLQTRAALAQFQAAMTHGHPTALAAADLTAFAIADLIAGGDPARLPGHLRAYAGSQRSIWHGDWLDPLWESPGVDTPLDYIGRGWDECLTVLDRLDAALRYPDREADPCLATGQGWVAEEAFATGMLCFLLYPEDPVAAIRRAAVTVGDSDSIGCLAGAFAGAHLGLAAWPADWVARIEYHDEIAMMGTAWDR